MSKFLFNCPTLKADYTLTGFRYLQPVPAAGYRKRVSVVASRLNKALLRFLHEFRKNVLLVLFQPSPTSPKSVSRAVVSSHVLAPAPRHFGAGYLAISSLTSALEVSQS